MVHIAAHAPVQPVRVVLDCVLGARAVGHALLADVGPRERGLDAARGVGRKGQRDRPGGRDRQQVRVADAVSADALLQLSRQPRRAVRLGQVLVGVEQREATFLGGQIGRGAVGAIAHRRRNAAGHRPRLGAVVAQVQHRQRVAQPGEAQPDAPLVGSLGGLLGQRPQRGVEHVVERADGGPRHIVEFREVEAGRVAERIDDEAGQVDRAEAAAAVGRKRLLATRVRRRDRLAVRQVVIAVHAVDEDHARLGVAVGRLHDLVEQIARAGLAVDPGAVGALGGVGLVEWLGRMPQLDLGVLVDRAHESVSHRHAHVEVAQRAIALRVDEVLHVGVIAADHAHLRAAPAAGRLECLAALVEHPHVADRAAGARMGAAHQRAARADVGEVVAHAAAAPHRLGGLIQRQVDRRHAVAARAGNGIAHRLHKAVDQRGRDVGACRRVDPAAGDEAVGHRLVEALLPIGAQFGLLDRGQAACHAAAYLVDGLFVALRILLEQDVNGNRLLVEQHLGWIKFHGRTRFGAGRATLRGAVPVLKASGAAAASGDDGESLHASRPAPHAVSQIGK